MTVLNYFSRKGFLVGLFAVLLALNSFADFNYLKDGPYSIGERKTIASADRAYNEGDFNYALSLFTTVYNEHTDDAYLNYRMGDCYLELNDVFEAITYLEETEKRNKSIDPMFSFVYAKARHRNGEYEEAIKLYDRFKKSAKKKDIKYTDVDVYIAQAQFGKKAIEGPVSVEISAVSDSINSEYADAIPSITADGETLIFTSRRPDGKTSDNSPDGGYYQDIYSASWDRRKQTWKKAELLLGAINSKGHDANTSISPDGNYIYIYRNVTEGKNKTESGDLFVAKLGTTGRWGAPKAIVEANSSYFENSAAITADGNRLYFISERESLMDEHYGAGDIYYIERDEEGEWGKAVNLGPLVNSDQDEEGIFIHPDGKTLFFSSKGHTDNMGGYDIFKTEFKDGAWTKPVNLGYPINTHRDERYFTMTTDGKTGYYSTQLQEGRTDLDIYKVDLTHYNVITGESEQLGILKGNIIDKSTGRLLEVKVKMTNLATTEEVTVTSNDQGEYFNTLVANKKYSIEVSKEGYKTFTKEVVLPTPDKKGTKTVFENIALEREQPLEIVSKDLFKRQFVHFEGEEDSLSYTAFSEKILSMYVQQLAKAPTLKLKLVGHSSGGDEDFSASIDYSKDLAKRVAEYLESNGVEGNRITFIGMGYSSPIADTNTDKGRKLNRRVEVNLYED